MKKNLGTFDRIIRVILAAIFVSLFASGIVTGTWGVVLVAFAAILLLTSLVSFCPLYLPFGLDTLRKKIAAKH